MKFDRIAISNFMIVGEAAVEIEGAGMTAVIGKNDDTNGTTSNGSGKSAIWDALCWCLYGETLRGLTGDDIVCRFRKGGAHVALALSDDDGTTYKITRYRKDKEHKNGLFVHVEQLPGDGTWDDRTKATPTETQKFVDELVGMDWETFSSVVIFGTETLRFAGATDKEQKVILDKLLGTEHYEKALGIVRKELIALEKEYKDVFLKTESAKSTMKAIEDESTRLTKAWESETAARSSKLERANADLSLYTEKLPGLQERKKVLAEKTTSATQAAAEVNTAGQDLKDAQTRLLFASRRVDSCNDRIKRLLTESDGKEKVRDSLQDASTCHTCGQTINEVERTRQLAAVNKEHKEYIGQANVLHAEYEAESAAHKEAVQNEASAMVAWRSTGQIQAELKAAKAAEAQVDAEVKECETKIELARQAIQTHSQESNHRALLQDCKNRLDKAITVTTDLSGKKTELEVVRNALLYWETAFGPAGIRSLLLDHVTPFLTERANHYSNLLVDGAIQIEFNAQKELKTGAKSDKFEVRAINRDGSDLYKGNSGGEKQRIDVCVALALLDLARGRARKPVNLAVFDETFERVDTAGCERVVSMLRKEASRVGNVFVTTHNDALLQHFPKLMTVRKKDHVATVEVK